ncbi:MAG: 2-amino-4-hydroxy-6-hydroxymethyldihydropteridine diphosphokinase [Chitinophagaceae bacterium]|nr:2-amino-4-hydroxy-6-hydroxymethyldihydropteridine diphosphokinase [Chitinophagaceae bacterium]MCU0405036.1 2-amino-4-hydroxy-6-hydroxymethyldihydropteridine diphosphokinase [Chitinophagaceae bacterium]
MNTAYLLTGGNLGDRVYNLETARELIEEECGAIVKQSSIYETAAWGPVSQPDFLNQVLQIETPLSPQKLLQVLLQIENEMGRHREERYAARTIDLDILFYNDLTVDEEGLIIPHPRLYTRRFVLVPLAEIAPGLIHPILLQNIATLLKQCQDPLDVKKFIANNAAE